jgi:hypothetical protein
LFSTWPDVLASIQAAFLIADLTTPAGDVYISLVIEKEVNAGAFCWSILNRN